MFWAFPWTPDALYTFTRTWLSGRIFRVLVVAELPGTVLLVDDVTPVILVIPVLPVTAVTLLTPALLSSRIWSPTIPTITARPISTAPRIADDGPDPRPEPPRLPPAAITAIRDRPGGPRAGRGVGGH